MGNNLLKAMSSNKDMVKHLLTIHPHLRDDDFKLIANIWYHEAGGKRSAEMTAYDFFEAFSCGKYAHPETIRRIRQKIQEEVPELRGKSYKVRQSKSKEIRKTIKTI